MTFSLLDRCETTARFLIRRELALFLLDRFKTRVGSSYYTARFSVADTLFRFRSGKSTSKSGGSNRLSFLRFIWRASGSGGTAGMLGGGPVSPPCGHIARGQLRAKGARYPRTTAAEVTVRAHCAMRPQSSRDYARKMCMDFSERRLRRAHERRGRLGGETP